MIKQKLGSIFIQGKLPQSDLFQHQMGLYLVLPDLNQLGLKVDKNLEFSITAKNKDNQDFISGLIKELYSTDKISQYDATYFGGFDRYSIEKDWRETAGTLLFIGIFLSVIFLLATVLVIYYKQISEGYEGPGKFCDLATSRIGPKANVHHHSQTNSHRLFPSFIFLLPLPRSSLQDDRKNRCYLRSNQCGLGSSNDSFCLRCLFHLLCPCLSSDF